MPRFLQSLALAAVATFALPACIINTDSRDERDMRFVVTFEGFGCRDAFVDRVLVTFESGAEGTQEVTCRGRGALDVLFPRVPVGNVRVLFEALDGDYTAYSGRFDLRHTLGGSHIYAVDLLPATEIVTYFTFAGLGVQDGMTCAEAGISTLGINVGGVKFDVPCQSRQQDAASLAGIEPGTYTTVVDAFDGDGRKLYASTFDLRVYQGSNEYVLNLLPLARAGLAFQWEFSEAADCAQAGVAIIEFNLIDAAGNELYAGTANCGSGGVSFNHDDADGGLDAGLYMLEYVYGVAANNVDVPYQANAVPLYAPAGRTQNFIVTLD